MPSKLRAAPRWWPPLPHPLLDIMTLRPFIRLDNAIPVSRDQLWEAHSGRRPLRLIGRRRNRAVVDQALRRRGRSARSARSPISRDALRCPRTCGGGPYIARVSEIGPCRPNWRGANRIEIQAHEKGPLSDNVLDGEIHDYRCLVGHRYSARSLLGSSFLSGGEGAVGDSRLP
jgi:hypothetical protein